MNFGGRKKVMLLQRQFRIIATESEKCNCASHQRYTVVGEAFVFPKKKKRKEKKKGLTNDGPTY